MSTIEIRVADFSVAPGGRLKEYSLYSGEEFRESVLLPTIESGNKIRVLLDGVRGYGSSFLEEAFGGLVRRLGWTSERDIAAKIEIVSEENPSWVEESYEYMRDSLKPAPNEIKLIRIVGEVAVVTATPDFHPLRQIRQITTELDRLDFEGVVLFDLLAVNGLAPNRFASMRFNKDGFDRASFAVESEVAPSIKGEQDALAKSDPTFLLGSVLSSREVEEFAH